MKYSVLVTRRATKQIMKIRQNDRPRILAGIDNLKNSETWGDVRKLVNHRYDYRLRIGTYRVLFNATEDRSVEVNEVAVEEVKKRDERTY